jgi:hypothetical protein
MEDSTLAWGAIVCNAKGRAQKILSPFLFSFPSWLLGNASHLLSPPSRQPFLFSSHSQFLKNASYLLPPPSLHEAFPRILEVAPYCMPFPPPFFFKHLSSSAFSCAAAFYARSALWLGLVEIVPSYTQPFLFGLSLWSEQGKLIVMPT